MRMPDIYRSINNQKDEKQQFEMSCKYRQRFQFFPAAPKSQYLMANIRLL